MKNAGEPVEEPDLPERDPADLSPRQGEGALRAAYEVDASQAQEDVAELLQTLLRLGVAARSES